MHVLVGLAIMFVAIFVVAFFWGVRIDRYDY